MVYNPYAYGGYPPCYALPVPDQLAQPRQNQMMQQPVQPQMQMQAPQQQDTGSILWVQGEAGAKAYLVARGKLWDSENPVIYLKPAGMSGMPPMQILDYTERNAAQAQKQQIPQVDLSIFVTREELENIFAERLKRPAKASKAKEDAENG